MKKILAVLFAVCLLCTSAFPSLAAEPATPPAGEIVLSEATVAQKKEARSLATPAEKREYLHEILQELGADVTLADRLDDTFVDALANAEEFGYSTPAASPTTYSSDTSGNNVRQYEDIDLLIIWGRTGNEYSIIGGCEWKKLPVMRLKDIISLDIGSGSIQNTQVLSVVYTKNGQSYEDAYDRNSNEYRGIGTACAFEFNLPNSADTMSIIIGYTINTPNRDNTISLQYFHKYLPATLSIGVSHVVGISVSLPFARTEYSLQCGT